MRDAARNQGGVGAMMGAVTGIGLGVGAGLPFANSMAKAVMPAITTAQPPASSSVERLQAIKMMFDNGLITQEEYNSKKGEILASL